MNFELKPIIDKHIEIFFDNLGKDYTILKDFILAGGKRIRPVFMINAYKAVAGTNVNITPASLSVEFLHNSTLIHDDIMDEDDTRRNNPTVHKQIKDKFLKTHDEKPQTKLFTSLSTRYAVSDAIIHGNILCSLGITPILESNAQLNQITKAVNIYTSAYNNINKGQILDNQFEQTNPTEQDYLNMVELKTANLFKASVQLGAVLGNATQAQTEALSNYAINAALAFQLQDDLLDLTPAKGNTSGSDIRKGKRTLILIKALESATPDQAEYINHIVGNESATEEDIQQVISIFNETGAIDYVNQLAKQKIEQAKTHLNNAELESKPKEFFIQLADYMLQRQY
jgi:geranylgeranyl diphosphate synthase type I